MTDSIRVFSSGECKNDNAEQVLHKMCDSRDNAEQVLHKMCDSRTN